MFIHVRAHYMYVPFSYSFDNKNIYDNKNYRNNIKNQCYILSKLFFFIARSPNTNVTTSYDNYRVINFKLHDRYLRIQALYRREKPRESIIAFRKRTFMPIRSTLHTG